MEIKKLYEIIDNDKDMHCPLGEKKYWEELWSHYIAEKSSDYKSLDMKEAIPRLISEQNLRTRRNVNNCAELGVDIRVGDICYVDFGEAYISEVGYQHFAIILSLFHNKAFVVPMSSNRSAYMQAYSLANPNGKRHLMRFEKVGDMKSDSVLFINDAKFINTARIIDVKGHVNRNGAVFREIKNRILTCLE